MDRCIHVHTHEIIQPLKEKPSIRHNMDEPEVYHALQNKKKRNIA